MKAMDLERQRWQEYQDRKQNEARIAEHEALVAKVKSQTQNVFKQDILDQLLSNAGYKNYRIQLDSEFEWEVQENRKTWGWEHIDCAGFGSRRTVKQYKTLAGACKRVQKEIGI